MDTVIVTLSRESRQRLASMAAQLGVAPEELARAGVEDLLAQPESEFLSIAKGVLLTYSELYRRLA